MPPHVYTVLLCPQLLMSFPVSTSFQTFFAFQISLTRFLFDPPLRLTKVNPGFQARLQFFLQTEIQVQSPWPLKFLRWVFIYSFFISSPVIVIFPDHRKFLAFAWDLGTGIIRYFLLCVLPFRLLSASLKTLQKSRRSKGIPITIFLDFGLGGGGAYRVRGQNLQFVDCPCRFAKVWLCSYSQRRKVPLGARSNFLVASCSSQHYTLDRSIRATDEDIDKLSHGLAALSSYKSSSTLHVLRVPLVAGQIYLFTSCSVDTPAQRECTRTGLRSHAKDLDLKLRGVRGVYHGPISLLSC